MSSDSIGFSIRATTGSHSTVITGGVEQEQEQEQESKETTFTPPFAFETPTTDVLKLDSSDTFESSRRTKHRSNVASQRIARRTGTGPAVSNLDSPTSILARLDLCNVPKNEFILATPNQVRSLAIKYRPPTSERPRAISISTSDSDTDPSSDLLSWFFLAESHHRSPTRPTESGPNRATTTTSRVFLPMTEHDQEEGVSPVEEAGLDETDTGYGFRPKPSPQNYQYATERDRIQNFSDDKM
jgi:hypothetical protein